MTTIIGFSWTSPGGERTGHLCVLENHRTAGCQRAVDGQLGSLTAGTALYFNLNNTYFDQKQVPVKAAARR